MGSKTIKICDCCGKELDSSSHFVRLTGESNFGSWKNLEFCDILCFLSYMDGNIRAYKEALEKELEQEGSDAGGREDEQLLTLIRMVSGAGKNLGPFVKEELALYEKYTNKFETNPFEEAEKKPSGIRHLDLDD